MGSSCVSKLCAHRRAVPLDPVVHHWHWHCSKIISAVDRNICPHLIWTEEEVSRWTVSFKYRFCFNPWAKKSFHLSIYFNFKNINLGQELGIPILSGYLPGSTLCRSILELGAMDWPSFLFCFVLSPMNQQMFVLLLSLSSWQALVTVRTLLVAHGSNLWSKFLILLSDLPWDRDWLK